MKQQYLAVGVVAAWVLGATSAHAGDVGDVGPTVQSALEMQRSGRQAAPVRPMLSDVADRTYDRYLERFTYPIPEQFERDEAFAAGVGN